MKPSIQPPSLTSSFQQRTGILSKKWKLNTRKTITIASFLLPALILYGVFMLYPIIDAVRLSLFKWNGAAPTMEFVGVQNYIELAKDNIFLGALAHNFIWVFASLILVVIPTLILAVMISSVKKGRTFFRVGFYLPSVLALPVIAVLWGKIYDPMIGPINVFLEKVGLGALAHNWLGDASTVLAALIIAGTWAFFGIYLILYLAGLQSIDYSLYEAADIDGAGPIRKFWSITIPSLKNTMNVVISMAIINAMKGFGLIWIMTKGGPFYKSELVSTYVYKSAFSMQQVGYASAASVVLGIIVITITVLFNYISERNE
jgi:raffinose/stachyose/melibiose transport system permease protein